MSGFFAVPSPEGAFIYYAKSDSGGIFRAEESGLNEELVYNSESSGQRFIPLLPFPGGNDLLAVGISGATGKNHFYRINTITHQAIDLGEIEVFENSFDVEWAEPGKPSCFPGR